MTPQDITVFEVLAGLFTLSFMVLCYAVVRFMQGMERGREELLLLAARLEVECRPILQDLQAGAAQFRATGELARRGAEGFADLGEQVGRFSSITKHGVRGAWSILAQAVGTFFQRNLGARHE